MISQLTLIFYPQQAGMHLEMLYTNRRFEICQERMFVKKHRINGWSISLLPKKNIYDQAKIVKYLHDMF